jgi:hypothetical protein
MIIYKYILNDLSVGKPQIILMPKSSHILDFRWQSPRFTDPRPVLWAEVPDSFKEFEERTFILHFTGDTTKPNEIYLGTDFSPDDLVYHLFEVIND